MISAMISTQRRMGEGLQPVSVGGAVQSFLARPSIIDDLYSENLFTMGGAVPPPGTDPASWPWPWDWRWWGPDKEDKPVEELPKGSEPAPIVPSLGQTLLTTNLLALVGVGLLAFWIWRKT